MQARIPFLGLSACVVLMSACSQNTPVVSPNPLPRNVYFAERMLSQCQLSSMADAIVKVELVNAGAPLAKKLTGYADTEWLTPVSVRTSQAVRNTLSAGGSTVYFRGLLQPDGSFEDGRYTASPDAATPASGYVYVTLVDGLWIVEAQGFVWEGSDNLLHNTGSFMSTPVAESALLHAETGFTHGKADCVAPSAQAFVNQYPDGGVAEVVGTKH